MFSILFVADRELAVTGELGEDASDVPSVPAGTIVAVDAAVSDPRNQQR